MELQQIQQNKKSSKQFCEAKYHETSECERKGKFF